MEKIAIAIHGGAGTILKNLLSAEQEVAYINALKQLADAASEIGIERYVLDDGWFHGRHDDTSSLGDWWPDTGKYPDGLAPLADHVTALGMEFGLWVEPEMINPDSALYRAHPEWVLALPAEPVTARR